MSIGYRRPATISDAAALSAAGGWILAGGQSLMPRVNRGEVDDVDLVDINRLPGLDAIVVDGEWAEIGALVRLEAARVHPIVTARLPMLAASLAWVANPAVRMRGTLVGNLVQFGPGAEAVAVAAAASARLVTPNGRSFALGDLPPGTFATSVRLRVSPPGTRAAFIEVQRRFGHLGLVGCGVERRPDGRFTVCFSGLTERPLIAEAAARRLERGDITSAALAEAIEEDIGAGKIRSDLHADAAYRRDVAPVLLRRVMQRLEVAA